MYEILRNILELYSSNFRYQNIDVTHFANRLNAHYIVSVETFAYNRAVAIKLNGFTFKALSRQRLSLKFIIATFTLKQVRASSLISTKQSLPSFTQPHFSSQMCSQPHLLTQFESYLEGYKDWV